MAAPRLQRQIQFLREIDRLKGVWRRTSLIDRSRLENSAEHSWHLAMMTMVLADHAPAGVDHLRILRMVLVHDLVEIDAGDTFAFDRAGHRDKAEREQAAADRLFAMLPDEDGAPLRALWEEFEAGETIDARCAVALDRFAGLLQNWAGGDGGTWHQHAVSRADVEARMDPIRTGFPALWPFVLEAIQTTADAGLLGPDRG